MGIPRAYKWIISFFKVKLELKFLLTYFDYYYSVFIEILPIISALLFVFAYRNDCGKKCSYICIFGTMLYGFYYFSHEAWTALYLVPIYIIYVLSTVTRKSEWMAIMFVAYLLCIYGSTSLVAQNAYDFMPALATTFGTISHLYQGSAMKRKLFAVFGSLIWVSFGVYIGGLGMGITYGVLAASSLQSMIKDYRLSLVPIKKAEKFARS